MDLLKRFNFVLLLILFFSTTITSRVYGLNEYINNIRAPEFKLYNDQPSLVFSSFEAKSVKQDQNQYFILYSFVPLIKEIFFVWNYHSYSSFKYVLLIQESIFPRGPPLILFFA